MNSILSYLAIVLLMLGQGCSSQPNSNTLSAVNTPTEKVHLQLLTTTCDQPNLSSQFDIGIDFRHYTDTLQLTDSCTIKIVIKEKGSGFVMDSIYLDHIPYMQPIFANCDSMTSYSTKFNSGREIVDNYFGDLVVADLNFDNLDDIAVINDNGGNGGSPYLYYVQTAEKHFILDSYLTDSITFFPHSIDKKKRRLTTYVHAGAYGVGRHIYHLNNLNEWREVSHKILLSKPTSSATK